MQMLPLMMKNGVFCPMSYRICLFKRVFVARYMACIRGTLLMIIPEEPEYILLWLSNCEWNQLDGREAGLDLIIGDFGEM